MRILITGGAGYIGSVLTQFLLENNYEVRVMDSLMYGGKSLLPVWSHKKFDFIKGDICKKEDVQTALTGIDSVVHLACIVGDPACAKQPDLAKRINLEGSINLFEYSKKNNINKFIFASTCSNYGKMKNPDLYMDETSELALVSLYAKMKVDFEKIKASMEKL